MSHHDNTKDDEYLMSVYKGIGDRYDQAYGDEPGQVRSLEWLIERLPPSSMIVDIGCGTGVPACSMLAAAGHNVLGVDLSPTMVEVSRKRTPNAKFEIGNARTWSPTQDETYDAVTTFFALLHTTQSDVRGFFARAFKWLKPGGYLVLGAPDADMDCRQGKWLGRTVRESSLSLEEFLEVARNASFEVMKQEVATYTPKGVEAGLCNAEDLFELKHLFLCCRKIAH